MGGVFSKWCHIVYVEGNIGSGKTDLLNELEGKGYVVVRESITEDWTLFPVYKKDPAKWCLAFQLQVSISITDRIETAIKNHRGPWPIYVERSILSTYIFAKVANECEFITNTELEIIRRFSLMLNQRFDGYFTKTLFLQCPVDTCLSRIEDRNRKGEENITAEYLEKVEGEHDATIEAHWIMIDAKQSQMFVVNDVLKAMDQ
jgi:deoxyadenosine/deoxycytidine kinase